MKISGEASSTPRGMKVKKIVKSSKEASSNPEVVKDKKT